MSSSVQPATFLPGGSVSLQNVKLESPYIFVILLSSVILILFITLLIREIFKSRGTLHNCCRFNGEGIQCLGCQECCAACAESCDCCGRTSMESCFDACCPKRGSMELADIITCEACCSGQCCACGNTACVCAPTDVRNVNCLCCSCVQQDFQQDNDNGQIY